MNIHQVLQFVIQNMWLTQEIRTPAIVCRISHFNQTMRHHHHPQFSIFGQNVAMYAFSWVKFKKLGILLAWNFWQIPLLNTQEPIQSFKQSLYLIKFASTCFMLSELFGFRMLQTYNVVFVLSTGIELLRMAQGKDKYLWQISTFPFPPEIAQDSLGSSPPGAE